MVLGRGDGPYTHGQSSGNGPAGNGQPSPDQLVTVSIWDFLDPKITW